LGSVRLAAAYREAAPPPGVVSMRLEFHFAFAALGLVAAATGGVCILLAAEGLLRGEPRGTALLVYGAVTLGLGVGLWAWARRSRAR
jgi:hypothetical protein